MTHSAACSPTNPWLSHPVRVVQVAQEIQGVATYELIFYDPDLAGGYTYLPGQFNMLYVPGVGEIAISISGNPARAGTLSHTIRLAGIVTHSLASLEVGSAIGLRGPFGSSWPLKSCEGKDVIVVAGGIGLAPLRPAIYEFLASPNRYGQRTLLYGARTPSDVLYAREFDDWRKAGLDIHVTVDRTGNGWNGNVGVVTLLLERLGLPRPSETILLTCGPEVMMWYTIQSARTRGLSEKNLYVSLERNMNCAVGLCGHCQLGPEFICQDGPIFRYDRVASILKVHEL